MCISYLPDTRKIIDDHDGIRKNIMKDYHYTDIPVEHFPVPNIRMLYFMVCLEPESVSYGNGSGAFVYKDGRVFKFHYNIHKPDFKGPHISNQMTNVEEIVWSENDGIGVTRFAETCFGMQAFWDHTPMSCLNEEAGTLRTLMKSLQAYCRKENYCRKLNRLDKAHEKWKAREHLLITAVDTGHGTVTVISKTKPGIWCENQAIDSNNHITCLAHLAEGRALDCPYTDNKERLRADYPCSDYKEKRV